MLKIHVGDEMKILNIIISKVLLGKVNSSYL